MSALPVVTADELRAKVRFEDLIEPVAEAFRLTSTGVAQNGLIVLYPGDTPEAGDVYVKAGASPGRRAYIVKIAPWFATNARAGRPQGGFVAAFDARTGHVRAILEDEHYLSDIRTAAAGAVAARLFAPAHVETAAVLGAGTQAWWQTLALHRERPFRRLLLWARHPGKAASLAARFRAALPQVDVQVSESIEAAVRSCDVLITATLAREPLVRGDWLRPGQHVTAVGADDPSKCELDLEALRRARLFVDERATSLANGDVGRAVLAGAEPDELIDAEVGEVLAGRAPGRRTPEDITLAKFVGIGAQDLLAAERVLELLGL